MEDALFDDEVGEDPIYSAGLFEGDIDNVPFDAIKNGGQRVNFKQCLLNKKRCHISCSTEPVFNNGKMTGFMIQ